MRDMLFHGKSKDNGEWVEGGISFDLCQTPYICPKRFSDYNEEIEVLPKTVGEYTGLKDKNGKKIFEGHIVKCYRYANGKDGKLVFENLVVVWDDMDACFALAEVGAGHISYRYNDYQMDDTHEFEIIGNIYDNPELLEEEK